MLLISVLISFLLTCLLIWILTPVAHKIKLLDKPGGRKKHHGNIPLIGGIAMYLGLLVGILVSGDGMGGYKGLLIAGGILLVVGTIDDYVDLRASARFLAQILAALIIVFVDGTELLDLGNLFGTGTVELHWFSTIFTLIAVVGVINATNMSDGLDGLAGGLAFVSISALLIAAFVANATDMIHFLPLVIAVMAAFLLFNMRSSLLPQARIFMGNGGSMFLGLLLAWVFIQSAQGEDRIITPVTALWVFALPILDTVCIMIRRIIKGRSPFAPDREHFHHILLVAGYSVKQCVWVMIAVAAFLSVVGLITLNTNLPEQLMFIGMLFLFALYFWGMSHAWRVMKAIRLDNKKPATGPVDSQ